MVCSMTHPDMPQIDLEVEGTLAIQSDAMPAFSMPYAPAVWYLFATVQEALTGGPIRITVKRNGTMRGKLTILDGQTSASGAPTGRALGPLSRGDKITVHITTVGTTNPAGASSCPFACRAGHEASG